MYLHDNKKMGCLRHITFKYAFKIIKIGLEIVKRDIYIENRKFSLSLGSTGRVLKFKI